MRRLRMLSSESIRRNHKLIADSVLDATEISAAVARARTSSVVLATETPSLPRNPSIHALRAEREHYWAEQRICAIVQHIRYCCSSTYGSQ